ncbi:hypothetical protein [Listeria monocytogenes]|uniref:Uncharacterized protein n=1 Tax=Listeria monocytogenes TaxID=1639 RepID=A0A6C8MYJ7_LISMN|nr:hypothetical protein [Listeria monocytogenes]KAA9534111.1 hypothetical protein DCK33_08195 [Listeria monocytogenes]KAA9541464.1 hypothetical protein DCK32_10270 [Listeria monocytogenes]
MSSELVKKLELAKLEYEDDLVKVAAEDFCEGFMEGIQAATNIVKEHEAQQMKEPFYQLTDEQEQSLQEYKNTYLYFKSIGRKWDQDFKVDHAFAEWAIEQEKLEEEK